MRDKSIKLKLTADEEAHLIERAKLAGFEGRGAVVAYIRKREKLPIATPGALPGNQHKLGKTKEKETTTDDKSRPKPTTTGRRAGRSKAANQTPSKRDGKRKL